MWGGLQPNSRTMPAIARVQAKNRIIGQLVRARPERPWARRCTISAVSYSSEVENRQAKPLRAAAAAVSSAVRAALVGKLAILQSIDGMVNDRLAPHPPSPTVMRGLDPRIHPFRKISFEEDGLPG